MKPDNKYHWTEIREIDDLRVEIRYSRGMNFPAPRSSGAQWSIQPGIAIRVTEPEPYESVPGDSLYPSLTSEQFSALGQYVKHDDVRNNLGEMGAYVFEPTTGDALEAWLDVRIRRLVQRAHELRLRRDIAQGLALRIRRENPNLRATVDLDSGNVDVSILDSFGEVRDMRSFASEQEWLEHKWEVGVS